MAQINSHFAQVAGPPGPIFDWSLWKKAATAQVYQTDIAGVGWTIACNEFGVVIANQLTALNTDQIIINAAIVYVNGVGGGSVFVDESTYTLGASVDLLSFVYLYGAGDGTILVIPAATDHCIEVNTQIGWKIGFLVVATTGAGAADGVHIVDCQIASILEIRCHDIGQDGIGIDADCIGIRVHDCMIWDCLRYGINNAGDDGHIVDNHIFTTGDDGIWLQLGGTNNLVSNNRVRGWGVEGIDSDEPSNTVSHNNTQV